jgi:hypothetical protein
MYVTDNGFFFSNANMYAIIKAHINKLNKQIFLLENLYLTF